MHGLAGRDENGENKIREHAQPLHQAEGAPPAEGATPTRRLCACDVVPKERKAQQNRRKGRTISQIQPLLKPHSERRDHCQPKRQWLPCSCKHLNSELHGAQLQRTLPIHVYQFTMWSLWFCAGSVARRVVAAVRCETRGAVSTKVLELMQRACKRASRPCRNNRFHNGVPTPRQTARSAVEGDAFPGAPWHL